MKKTTLLFASLLTAGTVLASGYTYHTIENDPTSTRIYTLPNGLTVCLSQNRLEPKIQTMIAVRAGAQNDPEDATGLAHYQEHIMFKGTTHYGTTNYEAELPCLQAIDSLYEVYGHTTDSLRRIAVYHEIDSVSYQSSKIAIANEFDKLMSVIGASEVNAFTSTNLTCYHEVIPAGELERWAMIESDRFQHLVIRGFHTELETVYEEFNMNATRDIRKVLLALDQLLYPDIPYRQHNVIGTQEHLKNPSLKQIKQFYNTWYRPNNVAICMSGDLDYDHTIAVIDRYFGSWQPNPNLPATPHAVQTPLPHHRDSVVYGNESPELWMAWQMPPVQHEDMPALEMLSQIMNNGRCGIIDLNLIMPQRVLYAGSWLDPGNDCSTYLLMAQPKEGQTLEQTRDLLLEQVKAVREGKFDEQLLKAVIRNKRVEQIEQRQDNLSRTELMFTSFVFGIPYADLIHRADRYKTVTKADIVRVANTYLNDSYACVCKQQKADANPPKVVKPAITPIEMNRDTNSAFYRDILQHPTESLHPQFLDFNRDVQTVALANDAELLYCQNKEDELEQINIVLDRGLDQDPVLGLAQAVMDYKGTDRLSAKAYQAALYQLAASAWMYAQTNETVWGVYGLEESTAEALQLLADWIMTGKVSRNALREQVNDQIQAHEFAKSDQYTAARKLLQYGMYGDSVVQHRTLTPKQMKKLSSKAVLQHVRDLLHCVKRVEYFGPKPIDEVQTWLSASPLLQQPAAKAGTTKRISEQVVTKDEVVIAPYDANNLFLYVYQNWGETYSTRDEAMIRLLNLYLNGDMSSIIFQEMRESRALCYSSYAGLDIPEYAGDAYTLIKMVVSQNDKLQDCIRAFDSIFTHMPMSQSAFDVAKTALLKNYESSRFVRMTTLDNYVAFRRKGWNHDCREDFYRELQHITLPDMIAWYEQHAASHPQRYLLLGDEKQLDIPYLEQISPIQRVTLNDIFGY